MTQLHLAVALDGTGWHPASWREPDARPAEILTARYWADLVTEAERGLLDFVTFEDALGLQTSAFHLPDDRTDHVRGRLRRRPAGGRPRPADQAHRTRPDHQRHPHRAVPPRHRYRLAGPRQPGPGGLAPADHLPRRRRRALRPHGPPPADRRGRPGLGADRRAVVRTVRRGPRGGGGGPQALGQLGGRRGDPGRLDRALPRPRQGAPHRLRRRALQRPRPLDHPAPAAGSTGGGRPRARRRHPTNWPPPGPTSCSSRRSPARTP